MKYNSKLVIILDFNKEYKFYNKACYDIFSDVFEEYKSFSENDYKVWKKEHIFTSFSGRKFWGEITIKPLIIGSRNYFVVSLIDISEKKQKEETIKKLSIALSHNPGIIMIFSNDGIVEYINEKFTSLTGFLTLEIIGSNILRLGYNTSESVYKILVKLKTNLKWEGEVQLFNKKGDLISVKAVITTVFYENVTVPRYTVVAEDITKQKLAEKAFQVAEQKYQTILQAIPDLIFVINSFGIFTDYKSEGLEELYIAPETIIGSNIRLIGLPENVINMTLSSQSRLLKGDTKFEIFEYELNFAKGTRYYECRMLAINKEEVLVIVRNITNRHIAAQKLKKSEENYKNLVENSPVAIILHKGEDVFYANKTALETLGYKEFKQMEHLRVNDLILPEDMEKVNQRWAKARKRTDIPFVEMTIRSPFDGRLIEIESQPSLLEYNNEEVIQIVFREISVQKRLNQERLRASIAEEMNVKLKKEIEERTLAQVQLQKSNQEKEVLLKEVHHRVKNNMQVISSILSLQSHTINNKKAKILFEESQDRIKSMALIHESLYKTSDLAHIDFEVYIINLIKSLWRSYSIDPDRITYRLDLEKIFVAIDTGIPCGLILNELISNALKHAFNETAAGCVTISLHKKDNEIALIVEDNGKGLKKDFDLQNAPTLGLQLVTTLIEQINGKILIESINGTKFIINFIV